MSVEAISRPAVGRSNAQTEATARLVVLEALGAAAAIFDGARRLLAATDLFSALGAGAVNPCGRLALIGQAVDATFEAAAAGRSHATVIAVGPRADESALIAHLCALPACGGGSDVMLLLRRLVARRSPPEPAVLRDLFGFTPAEARLAALIAGNATMAEAAAATNLSAKSTRSSLERIYEKAQVRRRADLQFLLLNAGPPLRP